MGRSGRRAIGVLAVLVAALGGCQGESGTGDGVQVLGGRPSDGTTGGTTGDGGGERPEDAPLTPPLASGFDALFGDVEFAYGFDGAAERMIHRTRFEASDVRTINGEQFLIAVDGETTTTCDVLFLVGEPRFLCIVLEIDASAPSEPSPSTAFLFGLGADGRGRGVFEFCPAGTDPERCGADLAETPDGTVTVSVGAAAKRARNARPVRVELVAGDPTPYLLLGEQAHAAPAAGSGGASVGSDVVGARVARLRALLGRSAPEGSGAAR